MTDSVRRFLFEALDIRGSLVSLGNVWHEMCAARDYPPAIERQLGELAAIAALVGGNLKTPARIVLQLQGAGPLSLLMVECDEALRLRGIARTRADVGKTAEDTETFGAGQLVLTLYGQRGDPWQSIVPLVGNSLAAVFEHYLAQSEQQPARLILVADEDFVAGLFLQKLPTADTKDADGWNRLMHLAATLRPTDLRMPAANLLMQVFAGESVRLFDPRPVRYHCPRDEEKVLAMLRALGRAEVEAVLAERGELTIEDDICRQTYRFGADVVPRLFD